jgi:hypothetical protein
MVGALLIGLGVFPAGAASAAATAAFPMDVFFDVKQGLAYSASWPWFAAALALSVLVRSSTLASTLYLGDRARAVARVLNRVSLPTFDIDAAAAPVNLRTVVVSRPKIPRLAIFSIDDAAWLESDWRRPGEVNAIALSDHSGIVSDPYALDATKRFLAGRRVRGDERSWKAVLLEVVDHPFAPWRPQ